MDTINGYIHATHADKENTHITINTIVKRNIVISMATPFIQ
jgi:hypothetical protein